MILQILGPLLLASSSTVLTMEGPNSVELPSLNMAQKSAGSSDAFDLILTLEDIEVSPALSGNWLVKASANTHNCSKLQNSVLIGTLSTYDLTAKTKIILPLEPALNQFGDKPITILFIPDSGIDGVRVDPATITKDKLTIGSIKIDVTTGNQR